MISTFQAEIDKLKMDTLAMMGLAKGAVRSSLRAIRERSRELALEVMEGDETIDGLECSLDVEVLRLLALQQPVARDLRFIVGCLRISTNLERIGDEAVNMADRCLILLERPLWDLPESFETLADISLKLLDDAEAAFAQGDTGLARTVLDAISEVTAMHFRLSRDLTKAMVDQSRTIERGLHAAFIAHSLHRVCDRAANISEAVVFIADGVDMKHHCEIRR
jgi:phosphate transport system protein